MKKEWNELSEGDVVEFTHNGKHDKTVGVVVLYCGYPPMIEPDGSTRKLLIDCGFYKTGTYGRIYNVLTNNKYKDIKEGDALEAPRFTLCESISYKPPSLLCFCDVCKKAKRGAIQFYSSAWNTVCRDCVEKMYAALPDNNEQE